MNANSMIFLRTNLTLMFLAAWRESRGEKKESEKQSKKTC